MPTIESIGEVYLNDIFVGKVILRGGDGSWHYGDFTPNENFSQFANLFGQWSLLMHADGEERMSEAASEELRETEFAIDHLKAQVVFPKSESHRAVQINIDGTLIEWKVA